MINLFLFFIDFWLITVDKIIEGDEHLGNLDGCVLVSELDYLEYLQETEEVVEYGGQQKGTDN